MKAAIRCRLPRLVAAGVAVTLVAITGTAVGAWVVLRALEPSDGCA